jgi:diaminopimelate epimerase
MSKTKNIAAKKPAKKGNMTRRLKDNPAPNRKEDEPLPSQYAILRPGGNDTALVVGIVNDPTRRKSINDQIMAKFPNVEQVGFVNLDPDNAELMMAGGEFCGNATRSTAWQALQGRPGELRMKVSGVEKKLRAGVDENGNAWAQMPIYADPEKISFLENSAAVVAMEGITQVVMNDEYPNASPEELKQIAFAILQKLGLDVSVFAAGVMFVTPTKTGINMRPVVWVRDISTLFYESACGSGTTAVGLLEAFKRGQSLNLPVIQPTGMPINIKVDFDGTRFNEAIISGPIEVLREKEAL